MDAAFLESIRSAFPAATPSVALGAPVRAGECHPEPLVGIPLAMMNRHGLIAGATGTGKTKTLQLLAEHLSAAGVPVFLADVKGDVSGMGTAGEANERVNARAKDTGWAWKGAAFPVEFLSLTGAKGAQLRATVSSFGPLLLARVLGLNPTQSSVLAMVFKFADDHDLFLDDFADLRAVLDHLSDHPEALETLGGMSKATVGVLLRELTELEAQGAGAFFGRPEFDLDDALIQTERDGRGLVSVLELSDVQDKPALTSTFMMWMLARLYLTLPEVGDADKPRLVFFFDEAHLLFRDASKEFLAQVEQVVRLIRSKGVGVFFVTQSPKDVPAEVLGQLGHRVQHALRAFTPDDEKALRAAARTYPKTPYYDIEATLQSVGIGEALVTVLGANGVPTPPVATRMVPPASRMAPLSDDEMGQRLASSAQVKRYATAEDRESAAELLEQRERAAEQAEVQAPPPSAEPAPAPRGRAPKPQRSALEQVLKSPLTRAVATTVTRGLLGALIGPAPRRRRY